MILEWAPASFSNFCQRLGDRFADDVIGIVGHRLKRLCRTLRGRTQVRQRPDHLVADPRIGARPDAAIAHDVNDQLVTVGDTLDLILYWTRIGIGATRPSFFAAAGTDLVALAGANGDDRKHSSFRDGAVGHGGAV